MVLGYSLRILIVARTTSELLDVAMIDRYFFLTKGQAIFHSKLGLVGWKLCKNDLSGANEKKRSINFAELLWWLQRCWSRLRCAKRSCRVQYKRQLCTHKYISGALQVTSVQTGSPEMGPPCVVEIGNRLLSAGLVYFQQCTPKAACHWYGKVFVSCGWWSCCPCAAVRHLCH